MQEAYRSAVANSARRPTPRTRPKASGIRRPSVAASSWPSGGAAREVPFGPPATHWRCYDHQTTTDHHRLAAWGRLEPADSAATPDNPMQAATAHQLDQLRRAQQAGQLDPTWDPIDVLALRRAGHRVRAAGDTPARPCGRGSPGVRWLRSDQRSLPGLGTRQPLRGAPGDSDRTACP
jgi:hypothetical protein